MDLSFYPSHCIKTKWCKLEFAKLRAMRACVPTWSTCQRACVTAWFMCKTAKSVSTSHSYVPTFQQTCQRAIRRASFSIWRANLPNGVPIF